MQNNAYNVYFIVLNARFVYICESMYVLILNDNNHPLNIEHFNDHQRRTCLQTEWTSYHGNETYVRTLQGREINNAKIINGCVICHFNENGWKTTSGNEIIGPENNFNSQR